MTKSKPLNKGKLLIRFGSGAVAGGVIAALWWSGTLYWHPVALRTGVTISLVVGIVCGLLTLKWGNKFLQALLDGMSFP
jgi:thiamine transporter ThiT